MKHKQGPRKISRPQYVPFAPSRARCRSPIRTVFGPSALWSAYHETFDVPTYSVLFVPVGTTQCDSGSATNYRTGRIRSPNHKIKRRASYLCASLSTMGMGMSTGRERSLRTHIFLGPGATPLSGSTAPKIFSFYF